MSSLALLAAVWAASMVVLLTVWMLVMAPGKRRRMQLTIARAAADQSDAAERAKVELQQSA